MMDFKLDLYNLKYSNIINFSTKKNKKMNNRIQLIKAFTFQFLQVSNTSQMSRINNQKFRINLILEKRNIWQVKIYKKAKNH